MKINVERLPLPPPKPPPFQPVTLGLEFESQDELDKWTALFNYCPLNTFLSGNSSHLWRVLADLGGDARASNRQIEKDLKAILLAQAQYK